MKTKSAKKFPTVPVVIIVAIVLLVSATLAQFVSTVDVSRLFSLSNFTAEGVVTFDGSGTTPTATSRGYAVDIKNSNAPNYIGNLRVAVNYAGNGVGLIRVRVVEEWSTSPDANNVRQILPYAIKMPYLIGASNANLYPAAGSGNQKKWFDNRENDYCFYYATPVNCTSNSVVSIPLITGFDTSKIDLAAIDASTQVHIQIETDIVQVNRYPQFWKMNALPWTGAVSATEMDLAS